MDVGANHGVYIDALNAVENPPFVLAFEPNGVLTDKLAAKISRGRAHSVAVAAVIQR